MKNKAINILLVEDDEFDVMNIKRAFRRNNIENSIYVASNGLQAFSMLRGQNDQSSPIPSQRRLILLDLNLPQMSGLEFLQALRHDPELKSIPVVVFTSSNRKQNREEAYQHNVAGYLIKPQDFDRLVEVVAVIYKYWTQCEMT